MRRRAAWGAVLVVLAMAAPATGNVPDSFSACAATEKGGECTKGQAVVPYGATVYLKGKVAPPHAGLTADVWHKGPYAADWELLATVGITDKGVMKYAWTTTSADGASEVDDPNLIQFKIQDHGRSNKVKVLVLLSDIPHR